MAMTDRKVHEANARMSEHRAAAHAVAAHYDRARHRIVIALNNGIELVFPPDLAEGLGGASPSQISQIEISPSGLGLHWPKLDADLYLPALIEGTFGSRRWMAQALGAAGGRARSVAKASRARENGRKGGRPRKTVSRK